MWLVPWEISFFLFLNCLLLLLDGILSFLSVSCMGLLPYRILWLITLMNMRKSIHSICFLTWSLHVACWAWWYIIQQQKVLLHTICYDIFNAVFRKLKETYTVTKADKQASTHKHWDQQKHYENVFFFHLFSIY